MFNRYEKSSLFIYNTTSQSVLESGQVEFTNVQRTGTAIVQRSNTTAEILFPGLYQVIFNSSSTTPLQLQKDGVDVAGALGTSFSTFIRVYPNCCGTPDNIPASISVVNPDAEVTVPLANMTILKVA